MLDNILTTGLEHELKLLLEQRFLAGPSDESDGQTKGRFPAANSIKGRLVQQSFQEDPDVAAYTLLAFCDIPFPPHTSQAVEGLLNARLYAKGITKNVAPEKEAIRKLKNELIEVVRQSKNSRDDILKAKRDTERQINVLTENVRSDFTALVTQATDTMAGFLGQADEKIKIALDEQLKLCIEKAEQTRVDLDQLKEHYKSSIALEAPVAFWLQNSKEHQESAKTFMRVIATCAPLVIAGLAFLGWFFLANAEAHHWGKTTLFIFLSASFLWLLRIVVRLYLCHKHLEVDAKERVVLAKTYLALLANGAGPAEDHRHIVFQALFRPCTTGIIREDEHPNPMIELVTKVVGNK